MSEEEYNQDDFEDQEDGNNVDEELPDDQNNNNQEEQNEYQSQQNGDDQSQQLAESKQDDGEYGQEEFENDEEKNSVKVDKSIKSKQESPQVKKSTLSNINKPQSALKKQVRPQSQNKKVTVQPPPKPPEDQPTKRKERLPLTAPKPSAGPSEMQKLHQQIMKQHKEKMEKMKKKEDQIYVQEEVEKRKPKEFKAKTKQKLVLTREQKQQLEDENKNNQEKAKILMDDLAEKLDKSIEIKVITERPKPKQPKEAEIQEKPWPKAPVFNVPVGAGIKTKLEEDIESQQKSTQQKERVAILEMKKIQAQRAEEQMQQLQMIRKKEKQMVKQGQDNLKRENKILNPNLEAKIKDKKASDLIQEDSILEQKKQEEILKKQLVLQLRHLKEENADLQSSLKYEQNKNIDIEKKIKDFKRRAKVLEVNGKITSYGSYADSTNASVSQQDDDEDDRNITENSMDGKLMAINAGKVGIGEPTITDIIVNRIAQQGLTLKDFYHMLDDDGDGILTMNEIRDGIKGINLNLTDGECEKFIQMLDQNSDGILSEPEFYGVLTSSLEVQKEFVAIMGDIQDIVNPIILEERRLDLQMRKKLILKKIEYEKQKESKTKIKYDGLVQGLKEVENKLQSIKGAPADRLAYLKGLKNDCEILRQELRAQQEKKSKIEYLAQEKKEQMDEDIKNLTDELAAVSIKVMNAKQEVMTAKVEYQKYELKHLAYARLNEKIMAEMAKKTQKELELMEKDKRFQQNKQKNQEAAVAKLMEAQRTTHAIMTIQKHLRGAVLRKRLQKKQARAKLGSEKIFIILTPQILKIYKEGLSEFTFCVKAHINREKKLKEEQRKAKAENQKKRHQEERKKLEQQDEKTGITPQYLIAAIIIQKYFKKKKQLDTHPHKIFQCQFHTLKKQCISCQSSFVEFICRKCPQPFYCRMCFRVAHKNFNRRNHQFYEVYEDDHQNDQEDEKMSQNDDLDGVVADDGENVSIGDRSPK